MRKFVPVVTHLRENGDLLTQCLGIFPDKDSAISYSFSYLSDMVEQAPDAKMKVSPICDIEPDDSGFMFTAESDEEKIKFVIYFVDED